MADKALGPFTRWFLRPPRPHGETIVCRTVSSLYVETHGRKDGRSRTFAMVAAAAAALVVGWARPAPWLLALLLVAILSMLWCFAVSRFLRADAWGGELAGAD
jgi:hypothetical protein